VSGLYGLTVPPIPPPAAPGLAKWQDEMITLGRTWCNGKTYAFGYEDDVWYYDGTRVYYQIADYTQDPSWNACALNVSHQYRDYVISNSGKIPGWRVFPRGLRMAWERTGDDSYKQAVILLATNSAFASTAGNPSDTVIRETAFVAEAYMEAERVGQPRNPLLAKAIGYLEADFQRIFVTGGYSLHQPFFDGLAAEALIDYYQLTGDASVPPAVKIMLDGDWAKAYNQTTHELAYNPDPPGPTCNTGCQGYVPDITNLLDPAYAWYWTISKDPTYLQEADIMFGNGLDTDISYSGKIFSQNYRWTFDYVQWRTGATPAYSASLSPAVLPGTWMTLTSRSTTKCLTGAGGSGSIITQAACSSTSDNTQQFLFTPVNGGYRIINRNSGWSLGIAGNGAQIQQGYFNNTPNQIWQAALNADGSYVLMPVSSALCLDSTATQQAACAASLAQEWTIAAPSAAYVTARNGNCLSIGTSPAATGAGNLADQLTCGKSTNQQFVFTPAKGGYRIIGTGKWSLGVRGGPSVGANGALIQQGYYNGTPDQIWTITSSGGYYMLTAQSSGKCLTAPNASNGAYLQQTSCSGALSQQWTFSPVQ
jgi:Ricin-type beta-trefoil lectin domain-like/Ricin-type beta-trefoil lectin domain